MAVRVNPRTQLRDFLEIHRRAEGFDIERAPPHFSGLTEEAALHIKGPDLYVAKSHRSLNKEGSETLIAVNSQGYAAITEALGFSYTAISGEVAFRLMDVSKRVMDAVEDHDLFHVFVATAPTLVVLSPDSNRMTQVAQNLMITIDPKGVIGITTGYLDLQKDQLVKAHVVLQFALPNIAADLRA